jgi:hypothetical protein
MAINTDNLETVLNSKIASATSSTPDKDLLLISKSVEALDNSIALKPEDIGVTVQAYDATNLVDADIGVTVQAYDANAATTSDVTTAVAALVDSAPGTLDTLNELAAALGDDPNHVTTMTTLIDAKLSPDGDGSQLTNLPVVTMGGTMTSSIIPDTDDTYDIGSATYKVRDLYLGENSLHIGDANISAINNGVILPSVQMAGHIIPDTNNTYDIGSAEYKIRDLYVSDNSLWIGDDHKVSIEGGKQRNKKRKKGKTPKKVFDALIGAGKPFATEADLKVKFKTDIHAPAPANTVDPDHADFQPLTHQWLHFAIINGMAGAITPENIFDDTDDFELQNGIADVEGLQDVLDGKVDDSQVLTSVPSNALFTDTNTDTKWDGDPTGLNAAWGRTSLGLGTAATSAATDFETADADISKTDVAETRSAPINMADNVLQRPEIKDYSETKVAMGANDVDLSSGNVFTKTISSGTTLTFINPPASGKAGAFTLIVTLSGSPTIYWPSTVKWAGGTAPTLTSSGIDIFTFMTTDGGNIWYGFTAAQDLT